MKPLYILTLLALAAVFWFAEQKSRKWYDDRFMLRMQGFLVGAALLVVFL